MIELSPAVKKEALSSATARKEVLWPYYSITIFYLVIGAIILYDRRAEIGSLFESPTPNSGRLPLNSIGDVLAGFFAPLAFLWLFAATQLQRVELRLQREELADTRAVLNDQRLELERAAKESNEQTYIMRRTLEAAQSKEVYEAFGLDLYFLARRCIGSRRECILECDNGPGQIPSQVNINLYGIHQTFQVHQESPSTIDSFFESYENTLSNVIANYHALRIGKSSSGYDVILKDICYTIYTIESLRLTRSATDNELIKGRFDSLGLARLEQNLRTLMREVLASTQTGGS